MSGLCLCLPAAVDQPDTRHRATADIGIDHLTVECRIPDLAVGEHLLDATLLLGQRRRDQQPRLGIDVRGIELEPPGIGRGQCIPQTRPHDGSEVGGLDLPDPASLQRHSTPARLDLAQDRLMRTGRSLERNDIVEWQEALDPGVAEARLFLLNVPIWSPTEIGMSADLDFHLEHAAPIQSMGYRPLQLLPTN